MGRRTSAVVQTAPACLSSYVVKDPGLCSFGYPQTTQLQAGTILCAYYS